MQTRDLSAQVGVLRLEVRPRRSMAAIAALSPIATRIAASSPIALKPPPMIFIPTGHVASAASTSPGGTGSSLVSIRISKGGRLFGIVAALGGAVMIGGARNLGVPGHWAHREPAPHGEPAV
jgi:hypothetical protein